MTLKNESALWNLVNHITFSIIIFQLQKTIQSANEKCIYLEHLKWKYKYLPYLLPYDELLVPRN